jgi:hypothetical protein
MQSNLVVITPANSFCLTVLDTVKTELGIDLLDTSNDLQLDALMQSASGIVADYCNRVFAQEVVEETFWPDHPWEFIRGFMLERLPVSSITSVFIDDTELDPTEYRLSSSGFITRTNVGHWPWGFHSATVTYTGGYLLLDDVPYGLERATLSLITSFWQTKRRDVTIRSEDIPGVRTVTYDANSSSSAANMSIPPDVVALLQPFRRLAYA